MKGHGLSFDMKNEIVQQQPSNMMYTLNLDTLSPEPRRIESQSDESQKDVYQ